MVQKYSEKATSSPQKRGGERKKHVFKEIMLWLSGHFWISKNELDINRLFMLLCCIGFGIGLEYCTKYYSPRRIRVLKRNLNASKLLSIPRQREKCQNVWVGP